MKLNRCEGTQSPPSLSIGTGSRPLRVLAAIGWLFLPLAALAQTAYYVDGGWGSNAWDGLSAVYTNGHGPKLNIAHAISAASNGDTLSVAAGFYQEFTWDLGTKNLTLIPQGRVTVYDTDPATTDTDGDGMPDQWEAKYGLDGFNAADAAGDADSDGISNLDEYVQGTDPTNPDTTPPTLTVSVSPSPNAVGWNTNSVVVHFSAVDNESGVAYVTPDVTVTNEVIDELIEGVAFDLAGNRSSAFVLVNIDTQAPTLTGSPGDGDIVNSLRPPFVIEYSDELSGVDSSVLSVVLDGTNITAQFETFFAGALWAPTNDLSAGEHTWEITVADVAGHTVVASATFTLEDPASSGGPVLSQVNITDGMEMPDVEAVWVQGNLGDSNITVSFSVNFGAPQPFNHGDGQFGRLVPLEFSTNIVVITGTDDTGKYSPSVFRVLRTDRYRAWLTLPAGAGDFAMSSPAMGYFANGEPQVASGLVSPWYDEEQSVELPVVSVSVNGFATSLGSPDGEGNVPFTTTNAVSVSTNMTSATVTICWSNGLCRTIPLGVWEGYEVTYRLQTNQGICVTASRYVGGPCWNIHLESSYQRDFYEFTLPSGTASNVTILQEQTWKYPDGQCQEPVDPSTVTFVHHPSETITNRSRVAKETNWGLTFREDQTQGYQRIPFPPSNPELNFEMYHPCYGDSRADGKIRFKAPKYYDPETAVVFTFEGLDYSRGPTEPKDLTQITYLGEPPVETNENSAGYLITVDGGAEYEITKDSFTWPPYTTNIVSDSEYGHFDTYISANWLTFSGFHNTEVKVWKLKFLRHVLAGVQALANQISYAKTALQTKDDPVDDVECWAEIQQEGGFKVVHVGGFHIIDNSSKLEIIDATLKAKGLQGYICKEIHLFGEADQGGRAIAIGTRRFLLIDDTDPDLQANLVHEWGHCLGLKHSDVPHLPSGDVDTNKAPFHIMWPQPGPRNRVTPHAARVFEGG
jgi:hypothetical protein